MKSRMQLIFMYMVSQVLVAIFYKLYNIPSRVDLKNYALTAIERFQAILDNALDNIQEYE